MKRKSDRFDLKTSPLLLAIEERDRTGVVKALDAGAPVDTRDLDGNTPLIRAAFLGDVPLVSLLRERVADIDAQNDKGWGALHFAAQENHPDVVKQLLEAGPAIDVRDVDGNTPLSNAVFNDAQEIIELLLAAGADPSSKNNHDVSPADLAESMGMKLPRPKRRPGPEAMRGHRT